MARSGIQTSFGQLFHLQSGKGAPGSGGLSEIATSRSTLVGSASPAFPDRELELAVVPPAGLPEDAGLSSSEHRALLENLRDTGDPQEQIRAEYKLQLLRHTERFCSLMERAWDAQRRREARVDEECRSTQATFDAARALREKEALRLRKALEGSEERAQEHLRDRVLQQCGRHDQHAERGLHACVRFAETLLAGEIQIGRHVIARVLGSRGSSLEHGDRVVDSEASDTAHTRLSVRVQEALRRDDTPFSFLTWMQGFDTVGATTHDYPEVLDYVPTRIPTPPLREGPPPDGESLGPPPTQSIHRSDVETLADFDKHSADAEKDRERQWRRLLEQHEADLGLWRERHLALLASLASEFSSEGAHGSSENVFKVTDEADHDSARDTFSFAERWRAQDLRQLWEQTQAIFALHHDAFVERLRAAERGLNSHDYGPQALVPITPRGAAVWIQAQASSRRDAVSACYIPTSPKFLPPFSLTSLLKVPRVSRALPTAPPLAQMRTAFRDAQAQRDRRFEATLAAFEAEWQSAERKHDVVLTNELRSWRDQTSAAERERAALFSRRIEAARGEWDWYRVQRARNADGVAREFEERFSYAQVAREADFMAGVRKLHDHFMHVVQELLSL